MESKSMEWLYALERDLHPHCLMSSLLKTEQQLPDIDGRLASGIAMFRPYFAERLGTSHKQAGTLLMQLVIASDKVHGFLTAMSKQRKEKGMSEKIRNHYRKTLVLLESLLEDCGRIDHEILSRIPLTAYSIPGIRMALRKRLVALQHRIRAAEIEPELYTLLVDGLHMLVSRNGINRSDVAYALAVMDALDEVAMLGTSAVEDLLYQLDFNIPAFFHHWTKRCNHLLSNEPNLHRQMEILIGIEDRFNGLTPKEKMKCLADDLSICTQLKEFLKEKKRHVSQRIKIRRMEFRDGKLAESGGRLLLNLSVAQFGLLIRLFIEKGLLVKEDIGATFAHFAAYFRTPKTPAISSESLQKKSTDVEFSSAKKMKGLLIGMVNWLNEHYSTSNHNDS